MISFDLKCIHGHVFEGWFRSSRDYDDQGGNRQIACPVCGNTDIAKAVMAPAVAAKGNRSIGKAETGQAGMSPPAAQTLAMPADAVGPGEARYDVRALAEAQTRMLEQSQWVGDQFAEQARAIYYGERDHAAIHGTVDVREARALMEEGVPVAPLIVPVAPPDSTH